MDESGPLPRIMMVAVPVSPFQHSPTLGHIASSHTVLQGLPDINRHVIGRHLSHRSGG